MRVLHVLATDQRRGSEVFAADLIRALSQNGLDQKVAVLRDGAPIPVEFEAPVEKLGGEGARLPGVRVSLQALGRLRNTVSSFEPDVVQAHGGESLKYSVLSGSASRGSLIYRKIGSAPTQVKSGLARLVHRKLISKATMTVAIAEAVRRETIDLFKVAPDRVITIPNGVDLRRMAPQRDPVSLRDELGIGRGPISISIAALTWEKEPLRHVEVASRLIERIPNMTHLIVGDGPMRRDVESAVSGYRRGMRIRVLGSRTDIGDLLATSDAVLFASRPDGMEGMPTILIEAGLAGVPVVAFDVAGVSEVVIAGTTGYLVPAGDVDGLVERLSKLVTDEKLRSEMGLAARQHCAANFDIRAIAPRYLELYRAVADR
jgi:glycosyltransferase involved in cell wall biosynthesis